MSKIPVSVHNDLGALRGAIYRDRRQREQQETKFELLPSFGFVYVPQPGGGIKIVAFRVCRDVDPKEVEATYDLVRLKNPVGVVISAQETADQSSHTGEPAYALA